jgi:hypothetical protein
MSIGPDIQEALDEVGVGITIYDDDDAPHTGEFLYYKPNSQATKPFIREFFLEAWMKYNTAAVSGNLVKINKTNTYYMIMNLTPYMFEDDVIRRDGVLYKCNVTVVLMRPREVRDGDYHTRTVWDTVQSAMRCLLTSSLFGNALSLDESPGEITREYMELYARDTFEIRVNDRLSLATGQIYRVAAINPLRYDGVTVYELTEDTRPETTTTTTSTTATTTT